MRLAVAAQQPAAGGQPILNRGSGLAQDLRFLARMTMPVGQGWHDLVTGMPVGGATNAAIHYSAGLGIGSMTGATGYQGDDPVLGPCYGIQGAGSLKGLSWPMNAGSGSSDNGGSALWLSGNQGTFVLRCAVGYYSTANRPLLCHPYNTGSTWAQPYSTWAMERASGSLAGVLRVATSSSASATVSSSSAFWDTTSSDFVPWRFRTYAMIRDGDSVRFVRLAHHELGSGTVTELDETASGAGTQDWTYQTSPETGIYLANTKYWNDCGTGQFSMAGVWNRPLTLGELEQIHASPQLLWSPSVPTVRLGRKAAAGSVALTIQSMSVATSSANVALVQHQTLAIADMSVATTSATPGLTQHQVLAIDSVSVAVDADQVTLAFPTGYHFRPSGIDGAGFQNVVAVDPRNNGVVLSGCDVGGIHRSTDWGDNWRTSNQGLYGANLIKIAAIRFSNTNPDVVLAGAGYRGNSGGVLKSLDGGQTWSVASGTPKFSGSTNVAPLPTEHPRSVGNLIDWDETNSYVYAGTYTDGVTRASCNPSTGSGGTSWTTIGLAASGGNTYYVRSVALADADTLYVAAFVINGGAVTTNSRIYRIDSIRSGSPTVTQLTNSPYRAEELLILGTKLYAVSSDTGSAGGVWRCDLSADNTWVEIADSSVDATCEWMSIGGYINSGDSKHHVWIGAENPNSDGSFFGTSIMRCLDGAAASTATAWTNLTGNGTYVHETVADSGGEQWWFLTGTANEWLKPGKPQFVASHIVLASGKLLVAGRSGVWRSTNPTVTNPDWYPIVRHMAVTINRAVATDPVDPATAYAANTDWGFIRTTDGFTTVATNSAGGSMSTDLALRPSDGRIYIGAGNRGTDNAGGILKSTAKPGSGSWTDEALPAGAGGFRPLGIAVGEPSGTTTIVAALQNDGTNQGGIWRKSGGTWTQVASTLIKQTSLAVSIAWPNQGSTASQTLFLFDRSSGVYKSLDSGATWTRIWAQTSDSDSTGFVAYDLPNDVLFVNANSSLYKIASASSVGADAASPTNLSVSSSGPITVTPDGALFVARKSASGQPAELLRSIDQGSSWTDLADDVYRGQATLAFDQMMVSANGRIYLSLNGNGVIVGDPDALAVADMAVATTVTNVALVQHQVLTIQSMAVATSVASPNLVQHQVLAVQSATVTVTADAPSLTQHQVLAVQAASVAVTATSPSLVQHQVLAIDSMSVAVSAQSPGLVQHQVLTVQPMSVAVTSAAPTLGVGLVVADLNVATTAANVALTQHQALTIQSMAVGVAADNVSLSGAVALAIQSMAVATTATTTGLVQHQVLAIDPATIAVSAGSPGLVQHHVLAVDSVNVATSATTPGLIQHQVLAVQSASVAVSAQNVSLSGSVQLAIQSMTVAVAADGSALVQHQTLAVQNVAVATSTANVALTQHQVLAVASLTVATATQQVTLAASIQLLVQSMTVATSAGAPNLVQHQVLAVQSVAVAVSMSGIVFDRDPAASWQVGPPHDRWKIGRPEEIWTT